MKYFFTSKRGPMTLILSAAVIFTLVFWGCSEFSDGPLSSDTSPDETLSEKNPQVQTVIAVQDRHTQTLMADAEVVGTATTLDDKGQPAIMLLVTSQRAFDKAPRTIEGVPVNVVLTDEIVAMAAHTAKQSLPIRLGTSGGWRYDLANGYCCGGTLGSLVSRNGYQYLLSNYHVLEADIVSGGNGRVARAGDAVVQPGLIDVGCNAASAQNVAWLSGIKSLPGSNVDAAIARVATGAVRTDGYILEIGTISATTNSAYVGQRVKKSGRTTGLTRSSVSGINATVNVTYKNECAGGNAFTKTFTGQILVSNSSKSFLDSGDSGSLMVQDISTKPRAVGLLFAGSSTIAVANPINQVLSFLGAKMVGS